MSARYSIKTLLGLVAALCGALVLARYNAEVAGMVMVAYVCLVAVIDRNNVRKRALIYGTVMGVAAFIIVSFMVATVLGEFPVRTYQQPDTVFTFARKYAFPIGGFAGAVGGLLYASAYAEKSNKDE